MKKVDNIAKNTSFLTLALIIQKIISFTYFTILARDLDPLFLGKYYFAISFVAIISVVIDIGLTNVLVREIAKDKEQTNKILSSVMFIKIPLTIITLLMVFLLINFVPAVSDKMDILAKQLVYIALIATILDSYTAVFFGVIRGFHNLKFESASVIIYQLTMLILGSIALHYKLGLVYQMWVLFFASFINFSYAYILLKVKYKLKIIKDFDKALAKKLLIITIPFAVYVILQKLYMYFDSVLLSYLASDYYVGLYQISFKIIFALQFLPMAFMASLYPAFARYYKENTEQLAISFSRAMNYLIFLAFPISFGIIAIADKILLLFKPEYAEALLSLQIVTLSLIFIFLNFPIGSLLNACDRQKINTINMAITVAVSVILNFILIPKYNIIGASITVLVTNFLMFILGIIQVPKIIKFNFKNNFLMFIKVIFAVSIMAIFVFYLKEIFNIFLTVIFGGIIYFFILFFLGGIKKEDFQSIIKSFKI